MSLNKLCPTCGFTNPPDENICAKCKCSIMGIIPTEDGSNIINTKNESKSELESINKSINQGASNIEPEKIKLVTEGGGVIYAANNDIIGRRGVGGDVLQNQAISKQHAILLQCDNKWFIIDNHSKSGTFINGERIESDMEYEIQPGDIISLSALVNLYVE